MGEADGLHQGPPGAPFRSSPRAQACLEGQDAKPCRLETSPEGALHLSPASSAPGGRTSIQSIRLKRALVISQGAQSLAQGLDCAQDRRAGQGFKPYAHTCQDEKDRDQQPVLR